MMNTALLCLRAAAALGASLEHRGNLSMTKQPDGSLELPIGPEPEPEPEPEPVW
jgi:hypothetical protein